MNNQTIYWLWIQQVIGYASRKINSILEHYTFAEDFYRAPLEDKLDCGCFDMNDKYKLSNLSLDKAAEIIRQCREYKIDIVTIGDIDYPERLTQIDAPPVLLFIKGKRSVLSSELSVAMVGTRTATMYGKKSALDLGYSLSKSGFTIVSGGAVGIDTYSHRGALQANGVTICVLGCGIEAKYLMENADMRKAIQVNGAVISEYPPNVQAARYTFPQRNRIISGLTKGVIVVEAGRTSGSLITVKCALDQNRDVFAVPGQINSSVSEGTNRLIRDGAKPVINALDVIEEYVGITIETQYKPEEKKPTAKQLTFKDISEQNKINIPNSVKDNSKKVNSPEHSKNKTKSEHSDSVENRFEVYENEEEKNPVCKPRNLSESELAELSENAVKILKAFGSGEMHIDEITAESGVPVYAVHSAITELEIEGYIQNVKGRMYKLT